VSKHAASDAETNTTPAGPVRRAGGSAFREALVLWWRVLRVAYLRFGFGAGYIFAAAIALYSVVCLAPLGILLAAGLQAVLGSGGAGYRWLQQTVEQVGGEAAHQIMQQVDHLIANPDTHVAGVTSLVILVWAGLRLFETVERSLTDVWPGRVLRGYLKRKLVSLLMMFVAGVLLASFVLVNALLGSLRGWLQQLPQVDPAVLNTLRPRFLFVVQLGLSFLAFALVYKFIPLQAVTWRVAVVGALCATGLWHVGAPIFVYLLSRSVAHSSIYGGLAGVVLFSLWSLMGAWVLLLGAHFAAAYDHVFVRRRPRSEDEAVIGWPGRDPAAADSTPHRG